MRVRVDRMWGLAVVAAACAAGASNSARTDRAPPPHPDCARLYAALVEQDVSPVSFACEQRVELDGDGRVDRAFITTTNGTDVRLAIALGAEPPVIVGTAAAPIIETEYRETRRSPSTDLDFDWLVGWKIAKRHGPYLVVEGDAIGRFEVLDALGDGLWMTSGDVASLFYRSADGWVLMSLGC
jgi:hypothetical protein